MKHVFIYTDVHGVRFIGRGNDTVDAAFALLIGVCEHYKPDFEFVGCLKMMCRGVLKSMSSKNGWTLEATRE